MPLVAGYGVGSEVGRLRKVIVHRPELSLMRLTPSNKDELLYDDVLWVSQAQREHDAFVALMRERGIEVFYHQDLLTEALDASPKAREHASMSYQRAAMTTSRPASSGIAATTSSR